MVLLLRWVIKPPLTALGFQLAHHRSSNPSSSGPLPKKAIIAVCQMHCTHDKVANLELATQLLKEAKERNAKMVFYPEGFDFIGRTKEETIELSETLQGPTMRRYQELAAQFNVWISLGGFHERLLERREDGEPWLSNDHIVIDPKGNLVSFYKKMHLFDVDIADEGLRLLESGYVRPGQHTVISRNTPIGDIGLGVCYDLRFPEFAMRLRQEGADVLTYPSAFTAHTGKAHWESLLRARAIENQCFVIAAAQTGQHNEKRRSHGHSMIVDPWGTLLASTAEGSGVISAEIDLGKVEKIRRTMPVMSHKIASLTGLPHPLYSIPSSDTADTKFAFGQVQVNSKNVFLETLSSRAFVNKRCVVPGHVLVTCKRVVQRMQDMTSSEVADLFQLVQRVERIMESLHECSSSTIAVQDGKDSGQTIEHVHVHVLPRKAGDFSDNDSIYKELATHDKGEKIQWRNEADMEAESTGIRNHIQEHFPQFLSI